MYGLINMIAATLPRTHDFLPNVLKGKSNSFFKMWLTLYRSYSKKHVNVSYVWKLF